MIRSINRRLTEHHKGIKDWKPTTSLSKLTLGDTKFIPEWYEIWKICLFLARNATLYHESIEIVLHLNCCNMEEATTVPIIWKTLLTTNSDNKLTNQLENCKNNEKDAFTILQKLLYYAHDIRHLTLHTFRGGLLLVLHCCQIKIFYRF